MKEIRHRSSGRGHGPGRSKATSGLIDESLIVVHRPPKVRRKGIVRRPRERTAAQRPVTARQREVLDALVAAGGCSTRPQLSLATGRNGNSVTSALYALADRGLVERGSEWRVL